MWLIILEALAALLILIGIVWWTMFSGRPRGELPAQESGASGHAAASRPEEREGGDRNRAAEPSPEPAQAVQRSSSETQR